MCRVRRTDIRIAAHAPVPSGTVLYPTQLKGTSTGSLYTHGREGMYRNLLVHRIILRAVVLEPCEYSAEAAGFVGGSSRFCGPDLAIHSQLTVPDTVD